MSRAVVLLPDPDSPTSATTSPRWIENETSSRAWTTCLLTRPPTGKCLVRLRTSMSGSTLSAGPAPAFLVACSMAMGSRLRSYFGIEMTGDEMARRHLRQLRHDLVAH